ncbi:MAG: hypothetical protein ABI597_12975 [Gammaproteobacteria bacterium]
MAKYTAKDTSSKLMLCIVSSSIASLGTVPYGYHFADFLQQYHPIGCMLLGIILAVTAAVANIALGTYSLLSFDLKQKKIIGILLISCVSAISYGCMNFFAYEKILPVILTSLMTLAVILTNAAIASVALLTTFNNLDFHKKQSNLVLMLMQLIGFMAGILASLAIYAAAAHGISILLGHYYNVAVANYLGFWASIIIWIPSAALFGNSTQSCFEAFYYWIKRFPNSLKRIHKKQILILIFSLLSSASYAQIAVTFFHPEMNIPYIFKTTSAQIFIHYYIIPLSMLACFFVHYLALIKLLETFPIKKKISSTFVLN